MDEYEEGLLHKLCQFPNDIVTLYYAMFAGMFIRKNIEKDIGKKYLVSLGRVSSPKRNGETEIDRIDVELSAKDAYKINQVGINNLTSFLVYNPEMKKELEQTMKDIMGIRLVESLFCSETT